MVHSAKHAMPHTHIVQMTDTVTAQIDGSDEVIRKPYDGKYLMSYRLLHLRDFPPCDAMFLDTDVIVQKDVTMLFDERFDIALTRRTGPILDSAGNDAAQLMPYNTGVMFSRASGSPFWHSVYDYCRQLPDQLQKWWGDQFSVKAVAESTPCTILELSCESYNYTPLNQNEDISGKFIVHYKGERKAWMLAAHSANP